MSRTTRIFPGRRRSVGTLFRLYSHLTSAFHKCPFDEVTQLRLSSFLLSNFLKEGGGRRGRVPSAQGEARGAAWSHVSSVFFCRTKENNKITKWDGHKTFWLLKFRGVVSSTLDQCTLSLTGQARSVVHCC